MIQEATQFTVDGTTIHAYFHRPSNDDGKSLPIVVMANGYATEWQFGTAKFIDAFTSAGIATLNFDYRSFGQSDGMPRQVVDIPGQQEDFSAAIVHARAQSWVDTSRLVIWGSSLGGGHAISMAAKYPEVCAMVAQVPHCCSRAAFKTVSLSSVLTGMGRAIADSVASLWGATPRLLTVFAEPEDYGVMNHPGWLREYQVLSEGSQTWENHIPARSLLKGGDYRPMQVAEHIQCPALLVAAKEDAGVPLDSVKTTSERIKGSTLKIIEGDHFGVYHGPYIDDVVASELAFVKHHVFAG